MTDGNDSSMWFEQTASKTEPFEKLKTGYTRVGNAKIEEPFLSFYFYFSCGLKPGVSNSLSPGTISVPPLPSKG